MQVEIYQNKRMGSNNTRTSQKNNNPLGDLAGRDIYKYGKIDLGGKTQIEKLYERLEEEKNKSLNFSEIIDELNHYKTYSTTEKVLDLDQKLLNGNRGHLLSFATVCKEKFTRKLIRNEHSETAQTIYAFLLAKIYSSFQLHVYPDILADKDEKHISQLIQVFILNPIEDLLGENLLRIYDDEINGMIYYLTGNCHIKWK